MKNLTLRDLCIDKAIELKLEYGFVLYLETCPYSALKYRWNWLKAQ